MANAGELKIGGRTIVRGSGPEHLINSGFATGISGWLRYIVVNGVCILTIAISSSSTGANKTIYSSLPKAKSYVIATTPDNSNTLYMYQNTTTLIGNFNTTTTQVFQLIYAVADDYVES